MSTLGEWWGETWGKVKHAPAILPTTVRIPAARTDEPPHERFRRDAHYFEVTVNRIFLKYDRELWKTYAPMALVVTEFQYDAKDLIVPFIVGPTLLEQNKIELPDRGFVFHDTRVAGMHPLQGWRPEAHRDPLQGKAHRHRKAVVEGGGTYVVSARLLTDAKHLPKGRRRFGRHRE